MKKILALAALISICPAASQATLYKWSGTLDRIGDPSLASGTFDVNPDGSLKLATLSFDNIAWQGFRSQFDTITPTAGNTRMYVADCLISDGNQYGEYQFGHNMPTDADNEHWWFSWGNNVAGGKVLSFASEDSAPTPEPSSFILMGVALLGFALVRAGRSAVPKNPPTRSPSSI